MGLIHWWPLNGNLNDLGTGGTALYGEGGFSYSNNGKIGKCGDFTDTTAYCSQSMSYLGISGATTLSFCGWYKIPTISNARHLFEFWTSSSSRFLVEVLSSSRLSTWNGSGSVLASDGYIQANTWFHFAMVVNNGTASFYINGVKQSSTTSFAGYTDTFYLCTGGSGTSTYNFTGYTNDVRIYNHALSAKEVKEISKGLVLHYDFNDPYVEETTNMCTRQYHDTTGGSDWGGHHTVCTAVNFNAAPIKVGNHVDITYSGSGGGGFGTWCCSIAVSPSTTYCYSMFIKASDELAYKHPNFLYQYQYGSSGYITEYGLFSADYIENYGEGWYRIWRVFTTESATTEIRLYFFTYPEKNVSYDIGGVQFERKDHLTPYIFGTRGQINLVSSVDSGGHTVVDGTYALHTDGTDADTYFFLNFNKQMVFGKTYYITCDVSGFPSDQDGWWFPICSQSFTENRILLRNGHCSSIFKYMESQWSTSTRTILDDTSGTRTSVIYITNIKVFEFPDIYDNSGFGNHGILSGNPSILEDSGSGKYCLDLIDSGKYVKTNYMSFVNTGTIVVWAKYNSASGSKMILSEDTSGMTDWYYVSAVDGSTWYSGNAGSITCYRDGVQTNEMLRDNQWHCYAFTGVNLSSWPGLVTICYYGFNNGYQFHGLIGDIKIFNTILSAEDILAEYQQKSAIDKNGNMFAREFEETTNNLADKANYAITGAESWDWHLAASSAKKSYYDSNFPNASYNGIGYYSQSNLQVSSTANGARIYSTPNGDYGDSEHNTWGGLCFSPMKTYNCLFKGHRYIISWHVSGQSSRAMTDIYWTNQVGWGQSPDASPTLNSYRYPPANFQGEMDCYYDFTINDEVFKTTGDSVHSGFEPNTTYLAYAAFKIGYTYGYTGDLGNDMYITNLKMIDVTDNITYQVTKTGIVKTTQVDSGNSSTAKIKKDGEIKVADILEY